MIGVRRAVEDVYIGPVACECSPGLRRVRAGFVGAREVRRLLQYRTFRFDVQTVTSIDPGPVLCRSPQLCAGGRRSIGGVDDRAFVVGHDGSR